MSRRVYIPLLLLLASLLAVGCGHGTAKPPRGARIERLLKVEVVEPVRKRIVRKLEVAATVEAQRKVEICARVPGVVGVLEDRMDIGRLVKAGETMLVLHVPDLDADLAQKHALLKQAEKQKRLMRESWDVAVKEVDETKAEDQKFKADVDFSRSRLTRISKLVKDRAQDAQVEEEAKRQLEAARSALSANEAKTVKRKSRVQAAIAEYELAEERIKVAESEATKVKALIEFATVKAPFDGVITRRSVDPGAIIKDAGAPLFTFMQMDRVRVLIDVPQRDVALLDARDDPRSGGKGDQSKIHIPALAEMAHRGYFEGSITRVSRSLDPVTRTMRAEIELLNPEMHLRPGMFGTATVTVEDRPNVLSLPASALARRGEGLVEVYVVERTASAANSPSDEKRGVLRTRPVLVGLDDGKEVEIREGLSGGEWVVARSTGVMRANDTVIAVTEREGER